MSLTSGLLAQIEHSYMLKKAVQELCRSARDTPLYCDFVEGRGSIRSKYMILWGGENRLITVSAVISFPRLGLKGSKQVKLLSGHLHWGRIETSCQNACHMPTSHAFSTHCWSQLSVSDNPSGLRYDGFPPKDCSYSLVRSTVLQGEVELLGLLPQLAFLVTGDREN